MSLYRDQLERWLKTISIKAERALDLGGASNPVRTRLKDSKVDEWVFFDNGSESAKVEFMDFDINLPLTQLKGYEAELQRDEFGMLKKATFKFDVIFCLEVFEYVWNPVQAIKNIFDLMKNDSVAYVSFPAIYPVHNPIEIDYLRYTKKVILKYFEMQGFTGIEITPRIATLGYQPLAEFYKVEGMHPVRKSDLPYDIGYLVKARKLNIA